MGLTAETQEQIREAAIVELKAADMASMTERKLRTALEERLGLKLGGDDEKMFLRNVIENFLDQQDEPAEEDDAEEEIIVKRRRKSGKEAGGAGPSSEGKQAKEGEAKKAAKSAKRQTVGDGNLLVCELGGKKKVTVAKWKNQSLVSIREYYEKDGEQLPGKKGIALTLDQWHTLRDNMSEVDEALKEL